MTGPAACRGEIFDGCFQYFFGGIILAVLVYFVLGYAVDFVVPRVPVSVERKVFSTLGLENKMSGGQANTSDPRLKQLQPMLTQLSAQPEVPKLNYRLFLMDKSDPNAFAVPGGSIGVTSGLLDTLGKQDIAVAFVIGHELGHFKNRDHLRGLGRGLALQLAFSMFLGDSDLVNWLGGRALVLMHRKYDRKQEEAADRFGLFLVYNTYGTTKGTTKLFEVLQKSDDRPGWAYMFSTHPAARARIEKMKEYMKELENSGPPRNIQKLPAAGGTSAPAGDNW